MREAVDAKFAGECHAVSGFFFCLAHGGLLERLIWFTSATWNCPDASIRALHKEHLESSVFVTAEDYYLWIQRFSPHSSFSIP